MRFQVGGANVLNMELPSSRFSQKTALKMAPFGACSEQSGLIRGTLTRNGRSTPATLLTHFYALPVKRQAVGKAAWRGFDLWFDCFVSERRAVPKWKRLKRLNLTQNWPILNGNWARGQDKIRQIELLWIDGTTRQISAIRVRMQTESISGYYAGHGILAFPNGLKGAISAQSFDVEANIFGYLNVVFSRSNSDKTLQIRSVQVKEDIDYAKEIIHKTIEKQFDFRWNGRFFQTKRGEKTNRKSLFKR